MNLIPLIAAFSLLLPCLAFSGTTIRCEKDGGGNEAPKLVLKTSSGKTLFLCGIAEKESGSRSGKHKKHLVVTAFRVFSLNKSGKKAPGHVFQSNGEMLRYWAAKKGDALVLDELIWDGHENIPAFETKISCSPKGCKPSGDPVCVFQSPKNVSKKSLVMVHAYMNGTKKSPGPDEQLIHKLAGLAYSGDKDAQAVFKNRGNLPLDGAAGEVYFDHQALLVRLEAAGCLPASPVNVDD